MNEHATLVDRYAASVCHPEASGFEVLELLRLRSRLAEIRQAVDALVDRFRPDRVILFGSHARGTADAHLRSLTANTVHDPNAALPSPLRLRTRSRTRLYSVPTVTNISRGMVSPGFCALGAQKPNW